MAQNFDDPLDVRYLNGRVWKLLTAFDYHGPYGVLTAPAGFITNFASIPRPLWPLLPPTGRYGKAAVIHDYCYQTHCVSKAHADDTFAAAMRDLGVNPVTLWILYEGVHVFGAFAYDHPKDWAKLGYR